MLFRAYVNAKDVQQPLDVPVIVNGLAVPGHEPITIKSHSPAKVRISPVENPVPSAEAPGP